MKQQQEKQPKNFDIPMKPLFLSNLHVSLKPIVLMLSGEESEKKIKKDILLDI